MAEAQFGSCTEMPKTVEMLRVGASNAETFRIYAIYYSVLSSKTSSNILTRCVPFFWESEAIKLSACNEMWDFLIVRSNWSSPTSYTYYLKQILIEANLSLSPQSAQFL